MSPIKPGVTETGTLSDREFLELLSRKIAVLIQLGEQHSAQLDHLDVLVHQVHQFIEEHKPAIARAAGLLDTGARFQGFLSGKKSKA
jgi:hypothetical protein